MKKSIKNSLLIFLFLNISVFTYANNNIKWDKPTSQATIKLGQQVYKMRHNVEYIGETSDGLEYKSIMVLLIKRSNPENLKPEVGIMFFDINTIFPLARLKIGFYKSNNKIDKYYIFEGLIDDIAALTGTIYFLMIEITEKAINKTDIYYFDFENNLIQEINSTEFKLPKNKIHCINSNECNFLNIRLIKMDKIPFLVQFSGKDISGRSITWSFYPPDYESTIILVKGIKKLMRTANFWFPYSTMEYDFNIPIKKF